MTFFSKFRISLTAGLCSAVMLGACFNIDRCSFWLFSRLLPDIVWTSSDDVPDNDEPVFSFGILDFFGMLFG